MCCNRLCVEKPRTIKPGRDGFRSSVPNFRDVKLYRKLVIFYSCYMFSPHRSCVRSSILAAPPSLLY